MSRPRFLYFFLFFICIITPLHIFHISKFIHLSFQFTYITAVNIFKFSNSKYTRTQPSLLSNPPIYFKSFFVCLVVIWTITTEQATETFELQGDKIIIFQSVPNLHILQNFNCIPQEESSYFDSIEESR